MRRRMLVLVMAGGVLVAGPSLAADDDPRQVVDLPPKVAEQLRAEMRDHLAGLDDAVQALAAGDLVTLEEVAEVRLSFGHHLWQRLLDDGMPLAEVIALKHRLAEAGVGPGSLARTDQAGQPEVLQQRMRDHLSEAERARVARVIGGGQGMGPGRHLPAEMRAMGFALHDAADNLAEAARAGDPAAMLDSLAEVTTACRSCHAVYRLK
ncbi:cytochrome c [Roseospirillum parvum]|uniref:Cytochrome C n=1 Tax=Roseospirillum parvum TaxID=83401 RepID=A0A1G8EL12_9PROT|nr:cytochrome c [Roseospirillum parvum]SDH70550.1 Cytochrome C' [Roseospirillum parvum]